MDLEVDFELQPLPEIEATFQINVVGGEHKDLEGRDLPDQHPISAITGLETALGELSGGIDSNHQAISGINQTISSYGDIVTHDVNEFATASQGAKADTALQPNDNITELTNNAGYITGITSSDVTTALGYTPYNSSNPSGYQANVIEIVKVNGTALTPTNKAVDITVPSAVTEATVSGWGFTKNVGTVTSVNNVSPVNGNVTISIPTDTSDLTNSAGFITSSALSGYATETWVGNQGYITQAVDDSSTSSTTLGWSASKLNTMIGDIESTINTIRGV